MRHGVLPVIALGFLAFLGGMARADAVPPDTVPAAALPPDDPRCPVAEQFRRTEEALPAITQAIRTGKLDVVAVGSATTMGVDQAQDGSFPFRMAQHLRAWLPGVTISLTVRGGKGMMATEMVDILRATLDRQHTHLVLWQTGTVEAVRNVRPDEFAGALATGAKLVTDSGANLVLIDPQYSRFLRTNADVEAYQQAIGAVAALPGIVRFQRYEIMRAWVTDNHIDLERAEPPDRKRIVAMLHDCLGRTLASFVLSGAATSIER